MTSELDRKQWWWKDAETAEAEPEAPIDLTDLAAALARAERAEDALAQCQKKVANLEWHLAQSEELFSAARAQYDAEFSARLAATAERTKYRHELLASEAALAECDKPCPWTDNYDGVWTSDCGEAYDRFGESGPDYDGWKFCPYCRKPIKEVRP